MIFELLLWSVDREVVRAGSYYFGRTRKDNGCLSIRGDGDIENDAAAVPSPIRADSAEN